jgi:hypothetical protein
LDDFLIAARKKLPTFLVSELERIGDLVYGFLDRMLLPVSKELQKRKHHGLIVRNGHDRLFLSSGGSSK